MEGIPENETSAFGSQRSRILEDTVFYAIYPDFALNNPLEPVTSLKELQVQILDSVSSNLDHYIWQHESLNLRVSDNPSPCLCSSQNSVIESVSSSNPGSVTAIPHLHGKVRYGDNLEDEWFVVFLLFEISRRLSNVSIRVWDTDGEFLLIEAAFSLPRWVNPENSSNRVFIRQGELHLIPLPRTPSEINQIPLNPSLSDSLKILLGGVVETRASNAAQAALNRRLAGYPDKARANMHRVRCRVPLAVAQVLKREPHLISLAVEGFYDRDIDSMKAAARMEKFLSGGEMVDVSVLMSRAMYAQLVQQTFQAPRCYPMQPRTDTRGYAEAELGMKIACGFEMMYQQRCQYEIGSITEDRGANTGKFFFGGLQGSSTVAGNTWDEFRKSLESKGYFKDLLPGSKEYRRLRDEALDYYKNSTLFSRTSEVMHAPMRRINEILCLPHSTDDFRGLSLPPSDDDAWLYNGEDELNSAILERQKEMETYESERLKNKKSKEHKGDDHSSTMQLDDFDLGDIAKTMQAFVDKVSSFEGAEVPLNSDSNPVELNVDHFFKDIESIVGNVSQEGTARDAENEGDYTSSSDMDFDESEDERSNQGEPFEHEGSEDTLMQSYSDALNEELKTTTLSKSFIRADEQSSANDEGTSNAHKETDEDFTPVDVDVNLVKSLLESFSSQQGLPGPASNLLGLMGLQLPQDERKNPKP